MKRERLVDIKDCQILITCYDLLVTKKLYYRVNNWSQKVASPTPIFFSIFLFSLHNSFIADRMTGLGSAAFLVRSILSSRHNRSTRP